MSLWDKPMTRSDTVAMFVVLVVLWAITTTAIFHDHERARLDRHRARLEHIHDQAELESRIIKECHRGP